MTDNTLTVINKQTLEVYDDEYLIATVEIDGEGCHITMENKTVTYQNLLVLSQIVKKYGPINEEEETKQ